MRTLPIRLEVTILYRWPDREARKRRRNRERGQGRISGTIEHFTEPALYGEDGSSHPLRHYPAGVLTVPTRTRCTLPCGGDLYDGFFHPTHPLAWCGDCSQLACEEGDGKCLGEDGFEHAEAAGIVLQGEGGTR